MPLSLWSSGPSPGRLSPCPCQPGSGTWAEGQQLAALPGQLRAPEGWLARSLSAPREPIHTRHPAWSQGCQERWPCCALSQRLRLLEQILTRLMSNISHSSAAWESKIKVPADAVCDESASRLIQGPPLPLFSGSSLKRALIPSTSTPHLDRIISQKSCLQIPSLCRVRFQHLNFGRTQTFGIFCTWPWQYLTFRQKTGHVTLTGCT